METQPKQLPVARKLLSDVQLNDSQANAAVVVPSKSYSAAVRTGNPKQTDRPSSKRPALKSPALKPSAPPVYPCWQSTKNPQTTSRKKTKSRSDEAL